MPKKMKEILSTSLDRLHEGGQYDLPGGRMTTLKDLEGGCFGDLESNKDGHDSSWRRSMARYGFTDGLDGPEMATAPPVRRTNEVGLSDEDKAKQAKLSAIARGLTLGGQSGPSASAPKLKSHDLKPVGAEVDQPLGGAQGHGSGADSRVHPAEAEGGEVVFSCLEPGDIEEVWPELDRVGFTIGYASEAQKFIIKKGWWDEGAFRQGLSVANAMLAQGLFPKEDQEELLIKSPARYIVKVLKDNGTYPAPVGMLFGKALAEYDMVKAVELAKEKAKIDAKSEAHALFNEKA